jgi:hypothetical protein
MIDATILWLKNWNNFSGRASRSEYWWVRIVQQVVQVLWWVFFIRGLPVRRQHEPAVRHRGHRLTQRQRSKPPSVLMT